MQVPHDVGLNNIVLSFFTILYQKAIILITVWHFMA